MRWTKLSEFLRKGYVQTAIMIIIILVSVVSFWYGLRVVFKTEHPLLAVASGSMVPVLYKGDLILIQGVQNACEIYAAPEDANPPGDIIVFEKPHDPERELIVHRAVKKDNENGSCSFTTQGDANNHPDQWGQVRETHIVGKYTGTKVPLLGYIALFFQPVEVKVAFILLWIILLVIVEFVPLSKKKVEEEQVQSKPL